MKITVLTSHKDHPGHRRLMEWARQRGNVADVDVQYEPESCAGGDLLFLIACHHIVKKAIRERYRATIVIHASDLPEGRGWSPLVWQILEGRERIAVTAVEAEDKIDCGRIWAQQWIDIAPHEVVEEINEKLFDTQFALMDGIVAGFDTIEPRSQDERAATYYPRRTPGDSKLDPERSISQQFDLLRISDPDRYPAWFELRGHRYVLKLEKLQ